MTSSPTTLLTEKQRIEVLHLCGDARYLADLIDLQVAAGIRPYLLTNPVASGSARWWLRAWSDVREWRRLLSGFSIPVIHAHTFSAGMAAVRGDAATVYQFGDFVESHLAGPGSSWMERSFRAAEHFVFAHAQAVVVESAAMRHAVITAGIDPANIFLIPAAAPVIRTEADLRIRFDFPSQQLAVLCETTNTAVRKAIALCSQTRADLRFLARQSDMITSGCEPLSDTQFEAARRRADIVIAADENAAATAMANGIALLAADTLFMRELSPNGEGCLWFASGEELASKLVFLAANHDFRNSLAAEGRRYILGSRSPERIGRLYREAYTFALEQRKSPSGPGDFRPALAPSRAA